MSIRKTFAKYVSQNILGMIGISLYILADTFFISMAEGADGITALNLILPVYSIIFALGQMIRVGSAIRFAIARAKGEKSADLYFSNALWFGLILGGLFLLLGLFFPKQIVHLMGGDASIIAIGSTYTRIFMLFSPCFMWNYICNAFVRNDGAPSVAMAATLCSSLFNIVMDYVLMFPLGLGMAGAALATAFSPVVGIAICGIHFCSKKNTVHFLRCIPSFRRLLSSCALGISSFIGELSSGVTTIVFNMLILKLAGNIGVAAYGVIANTSLVAVAVFNGVSQGSQPLFSSLYGKGDKRNIARVLRLSIVTTLVLSVLILFLMQLFAPQVAAVFNSEKSQVMADYAVSGLKLYFTGFLFAGFNIVGTGYLSAVDSPKWALAASISRGVVAIVLCAVVLSMLLGLTGVWLAFPAAELLTAIITLTAMWVVGRKRGVAAASE